MSAALIICPLRSLTIRNKSIQEYLVNPNIKQPSLKILNSFDNIHYYYILDLDFQHQTTNAKLASGSKDERIKVTDVKYGKILNHYKKEDDGMVMNVKFNPKMTNVLASRHRSGKVMLFDIRLGNDVGGYVFEVGPEPDGYNYGDQEGYNYGDLKFSNCGFLLAAGDEKGNIKMIDLRYQI